MSSLQEASILANLPREDLHDLACNALDDLRYDGVSKLLVCLRIRDNDRATVIEAHQPRALTWCQASRIAPALRNQDLRTVLEIPSAQRPGDAVEIDQTKTEAIAAQTMALRVLLKVVPEMVAERVPRIRILFQNM